MTKQYDEAIKAAAEANGLDPVLFRKQLVQESGLNPNAVSKAGAVGLAQIMPKYWTGQHGLNTPEDFRDPIKSINAGAAIMGNHVKTYGSWDLALVAYNAGPGKGHRNIKAFKEGRIQDLPKETQGYLAKLASQDTQSAGPQLLTGDTVPETNGTLLKREEVPTPARLAERGVMDTSGKLYQEPDRQGIIDSVAAGFRASPLATASRMDNPLAYIQGTYGYTFDEDDLNLIRGADIGAAGAKFVMSNAQKKEDVAHLIELARENRASATANRSFIGDLAYGIGEAGGDPITYGSLLIPGGIYGRTAGLFSSTAARVAAGGAAVAAEGALTNAASELLRESTTGTDADLPMALASGAAFSLGLTGVGLAAKSVVRGINRVEASETARVLREAGVEDVQDPTVVKPADLDRIAPGWREVQPNGDPLGVFLETKDGDVVHQASGVQFSSHNPLNPKYADPNLGGRFTIEEGDVAARSTVPEHRLMASKLLRTSRGYADGTSGSFDITAQDVDMTLRGEIADFQRTYDGLREKTFSDPIYQGIGTKTEQRRLFDERVIRAAEQGPEAISKLLPVEREAAQLRLDWYQKQGLLQQQPGARWGVGAPSLLSTPKVLDNPEMGPTRPNLKGGLREDYAAPVVYNELKLADYAQKLGGPEVLQEAITRSLMRSYMENPKAKARVDEYLTSIGSKDTPEDYARKVAYGIARHEEDLLDVGRLNLMLEQSNFSTAATPDFRKMRSPFDYHFEIDLPNGEKFSVNDLRSYDADVLDTSYANKVKGDVAIAVSTGFTPQEFKKWMAETEGRAAKDANLKKEAQAFQKIAGNLYGIGIREGGERLNSVLGVFSDLAFMKSSAFMGLLNYSEIAAGVLRNGIGFAMRAVPGIGKVMTDLQMGKKTAEAMRTAQNLVWGSALERAILPTYKEAIDRTRRRLYADSGVNKMNTFLGTIHGATSAASNRFWTARVLNHTTERIIEAARGEFFADVAALAHGVRKSNFGNKKTFHAASLSEEQMKGVLDLLKSATKIDADGNLEITNPGALTRGPAAADLRRYGQFWSERVIQQNTLGSTFRWSHLPLVKPLTQFMSFVGRSLNAKLIRGNSDIMRNGDLGEALSLYVLSPVMAGSMYAATTYLQSMKFSDDRDRKKFLEERLGTKDDIGPLAAGALKRMAVLSAPAYLYDTIGQTPLAQKVAPEVFKYAGFGKTSVEAKLRRDAQSQSGAIGSIFGDAIEQAPAVKIADSLAGLGIGAVNYSLAEGWAEKEKAATALTRSFAGLLPNDPLTQRAFMEFKEAAGLD